MKKFVIITSIFEPNEVIKAYAAKDDWRVVVVGDKKTPADWEYPSVTYLSPDMQEKLGFEILKHLPWNHYCRKMVGYLYAIREGAELIYDTDDDNIPMETWGELPFEGEFSTLSGEGFVNIYRYFTDEFVWPRGFPLENIAEAKTAPLLTPAKQSHKLGVWQHLANEDPDVDAIYRLLFNKMVTFKDNEPLVLEEGLFCPYNSQNTFYSKEAFALLYLPSFVTFRFTDILRGLVAQPILWDADMRLGFGPAHVRQERNPHNYMRDFDSEIPVYLHVAKVAELAKDVVQGGNVLENLVRVYAKLREENIVTDEELTLLDAWAKDLGALQNAS